MTRGSSYRSCMFPWRVGLGKGDFILSLGGVRDPAPQNHSRRLLFLSGRGVYNGVQNRHSDSLPVFLLLCLRCPRQGSAFLYVDFVTGLSAGFFTSFPLQRGVFGWKRAGRVGNLLLFHKTGQQAQLFPKTTKLQVPKCQVGS